MLTLSVACVAFADTTITIQPQTPTDADTATTLPEYTYWVFMKASVGENGAVSYYVEDQARATALDALKVGSDDLFTVKKAAGDDKAKNEVATDDNGKITFAGLHAGTYTLTETENPNGGYNMLDSAITITVSADGTITATGGGSVQSKVLTVENGKGAILPSTGGIGTTIFYIAGAVLVLGAAAIVIARRKAEQH